MCHQLGIEFVDLTKTTIDPGLISLVPGSFAKENMLVPVKLERDTLYIAMEDPLNFPAIEHVRNITKKRVIPMIAYANAVDRAIVSVYDSEGATQAMEAMREEGYTVEAERDVVQEEREEVDTAPTVRLVNSIIERGIVENASDIHIEPREKEVVVRIRVDGRLNEVLKIPKELQSAVVSRFKVMANMNIAERRIPQDGRAIVKRRGSRDIDLRLSSLPTIYGEKIVIRILMREEEILNPSGIGITDDDIPKFNRLMKNTSGVILIVGPTGSGKTSTLYTMINALKNDTVNMISLEDPVEFQIPGVTQVAINEKVGLTFASALRACLRQDPDIICIGEIRDGETAEIAMRAAMTGHLVLSTIHTEDTCSAIDRLKDMGIEPYLIAGSVRGIISQRLVRKICPHCKTEITADETMLDYAGIKSVAGKKFYKGQGCGRCFETGYRGRIGVFEILPMTSELRSIVSSGATGTELRRKIETSDFTPMIENGKRLVSEGVTTVDEIVRTIVTIE